MLVIRPCCEVPSTTCSEIPEEIGQNSTRHLQPSSKGLLPRCLHPCTRGIQRRDPRLAPELPRRVPEALKSLRKNGESNANDGEERPNTCFWLVAASLRVVCGAACSACSVSSGLQLKPRPPGGTPHWSGSWLLKDRPLPRSGWPDISSGNLTILTLAQVSVLRAVSRVQTSLAHVGG